MVLSFERTLSREQDFTADCACADRTLLSPERAEAYIPAEAAERALAVRHGSGRAGRLLFGPVVGGGGSGGEWIGGEVGEGERRGGGCGVEMEDGGGGGGEEEMDGLWQGGGGGGEEDVAGGVGEGELAGVGKGAGGGAVEEDLFAAAEDEEVGGGACAGGVGGGCEGEDVAGEGEGGGGGGEGGEGVEGEGGVGEHGEEAAHREHGEAVDLAPGGGEARDERGGGARIHQHAAVAQPEVEPLVCTASVSAQARADSPWCSTAVTRCPVRGSSVSRVAMVSRLRVDVENVRGNNVADSSFTFYSYKLSSVAVTSPTFRLAIVADPHSVTSRLATRRAPLATPATAQRDVSTRPVVIPLTHSPRPTMISDHALADLANGLGIAAMACIVLYHFVAVNGKRMEA